MTFGRVMATIVFILAVVELILGIRAIITGRTMNSRYNKMKDSFSKEEQKKRSRIIGVGMLITAAGAALVGVNLIGHYYSNYISLGVLLVGILVESAGTRTK